LDRTPEFTIWNKDTIQNDIVILPKLFRRLTSFFIKESSYDSLYNYLKKAKDKVLIRSTGEKRIWTKLWKWMAEKLSFLSIRKILFLILRVNKAINEYTFFSQLALCKCAGDGLLYAVNIMK